NTFIKHFSNDTKFYKQMMDVLEGRYYDKARGDDILTRIGRSFAVVHLAGLILNEINGFEFDVESVLEYIYTPIAVGTNTTYNKPKQLMIEFLEMLDSKRRNIKYDAHDDDKFADTMARSEERRVGKECRREWSGESARGSGEERQLKR